MKLGDLVTFTAVMVKRQVPGGSVPERRQRGGKGVVVGVRNMFTAQAGSPPQLSNPQRVVLVATSLSQIVRVAPADITSLGGGAQAPAAAPLGLPALPDPDDDDEDRGRLEEPSEAELALWVADALNVVLNNGACFSAYDITCAVRAAHPRDKIVHKEVRAHVHEHMANLVTHGLYASEAADYSGQTALRYVPL